MAALAAPDIRKNQYPPAVTRAKQRTFLETVASSGSHALACKTAEINVSTPTHWAYKRDTFRKMWDEAKIRGEEVLLSRYESNIDEVLLPETPMKIEDFSRTQISRMFRMKRLDPRYRDNAVSNVVVTGPLNIQFNIDASQVIESKGTQSPK